MGQPLQPPALLQSLLPQRQALPCHLGKEREKRKKPEKASKKNQKLPKKTQKNPPKKRPDGKGGVNRLDLLGESGLAMFGDAPDAATETTRWPNTIRVTTLTELKNDVRAKR